MRTAAERWLFDLTLTSPVEFGQVECDTGVVQIDSLHLNATETIRRAAAFYDDFPARVARETAFLRHARARMVVADIPPLGLAAAAAAGIPAVALGNFTWDWIYRAYDEELRRAPALIPTIERAYSVTSLALRLPMWGGFGAMDAGVIVDVPLVARRATRSRDATRTALGLPRDLLVVLLSFGGYGLRHLELDTLDLPGYAVVTTGECGIRRAAASSGTPVRVLDERALYASGFRYEDLVAASDVVVSKPGYGIIAECAANRTALLYTSRGRFAEYDVLVGALPSMVRSGFISHDGPVRRPVAAASRNAPRATRSRPTCDRRSGDGRERHPRPRGLTHGSGPRTTDVPCRGGISATSAARRPAAGCATPWRDVCAGRRPPACAGETGSWWAARTSGRIETSGSRRPGR